jgi:hypothetical protein
MNTSSLPAYVRHAERFGVELVFESAAGLGESSANLTSTQLVELARRLAALDPAFKPGRPDGLVALADAEVRQTYLARIAPVLDQLRAPKPTRTGRACEVCGGPVAGRTDRRTCSPKCRRALARAGRIGAFSRPGVTPTDDRDAPVGPRRSVTPTPLCDADSPARNGGSGSSREVAPTGSRVAR